MRYAIVSDIHANVSALRTVLADAAAQGAEAIVSLGDAVGYGPQPAEAVALLRQAASVALAGNHDDAVSGRLDASAFNDLAGDAVARHRAALSRDDLAWLRALPYAAELEGARIAHGDVTDPPKFYYVEDEQDAAANLAATDAALVFVGHTHVPAVFVTGASGRVYRTDPQDFTCEDGKRYIVNPGSVGYPREADGQCYSSYVLYDAAARTVEFRFLPFSVASVMQRGVSPRRRLWIALAALAAVLALGAAAFALWQRTRASDAEARVASVAAETARAVRNEGVVKRIELDVPAGAKRVKPNLELAKSSPPAELHVAFVGSDGRVRVTSVETVKRGVTRGIPVPRGVAQAVLTVRAARADAKPDLKSFAPVCE